MELNNQSYAIVDIETTGGITRNNAITEIAIILHDSKSIIDEYKTLINPGRFIPTNIQHLTGITNDMVEDAPYFGDVVDDIYSRLKNHIFVAHNVNFDLSFIQNQLKYFDINYQPKKLCTVRLARKIFPGHRSYSLGEICKVLNIPIQERHRAYGDALATTKLFEMLIQNDTNQYINHLLKQ